MATEEELKLLSDKKSDQKLKQHDVCMKLSTLIRARLREEFTKGKVKVPLSLSKRAEAKARYKMLTTSAIENRIRDLRKHSLPLPQVSRVSFQTWRKEYENVDLSNV